MKTTAMLSVACVLMALSAASFGQGAESAPGSRAAAKPQPTTAEKAERAFTAYRATVTGLRSAITKSFETKIAAVRGNTGLSTEVRAARAQDLKTDAEQFNASQSSIPMNDEMGRDAQSYERSAKKARQACRKAVKEAAADLSREKKFSESEKLLRDLDAACPFCIDAATFAARMKERDTEMHAQVIQGRANGMTVDARDELRRLVDLSARQKISAEDLTRETKSLIQRIGNSEAVKRGAKFKPLLEKVANEMKALLAE